MITEHNKTTKRYELHEMLDQLEKTEDRQKRIEGLRKFASQYTSLKDYLRCLLDDRITFNLPEGRPPYTPAHEKMYPSTWHKKHMDLKYFVNGALSQNMNTVKRETMWIQLLESISPEDSLLIADVADKRSPYEWLTKDLVEEAIPGLIS